MKVLLITGTPIRTDTNIGKTLLTMFSDFDSSELIQLYFNPETPNIEKCSSYYQICEKQIVKSLFGILRKKCGGEIHPILEGENAIKPQGNSIILTKNKNAIFIRWLREFVWYLARWKKSFIKWMDREKPDVIFSMMHDVNAITNTVNWISKKYKIPVILFVTDDYYHDYTCSNNVLRRLYYKKRQQINKNLAKNVVKIVGCSKNASEFFNKEFNIRNEAEVLYTPSEDSYLAMPLKKADTNITIIRYFGNLGCGRWETLQELGFIVQRLNKNGIKAILEVYSSATDKQIINELTIPNGCVFKGWVYGEEYLNLLQSTDIAVHVESFDESMIRRTWLSISTKIADYLGAGKCILAIGSERLASIENIKNTACIVTEKKLLEEKLGNLIQHPSYRYELQEKARLLANEEHNLLKIKKQVRKIINEV